MVGAPTGVDWISCQAMIGRDAEAKSQQAPVESYLSLGWLPVFWLPGDGGFRQPFVWPIRENPTRLSSPTEFH